MNILKFTRKRFTPYANCNLWLPLREMNVGTSPNLITWWNGTSPSTGWTAGNSTLSDDDTQTPIPVSAKCLKILGDGGASSQGFGAIANPTYYMALTLTGSVYGNAAAGNALDEVKFRISDSGSLTLSDAFTKGGGWLSKSITRTIVYNASSVSLGMYSNVSAGSDTGYFDYPVLTAPQMIARNSTAPKVHPQGALYNGNGFLFDGVDDMITCESDLNGTGNFTFMCWMKQTAWNSTASNANRLYDSTGGLTTGVIIGCLKDDSIGHTECLWLRNANLSGYSPNGSIATLEAWYHIALSRTSTGGFTFYINGSQVATGTTTSNTTSGYNTTFGGRISDTTRNFNGTIDDIQTYSRLLTAAEIKNHYTMTKGYH